MEKYRKDYYKRVCNTMFFRHYGIWKTSLKTEAKKMYAPNKIKQIKYSMKILHMHKYLSL